MLRFIKAMMIFARYQPWVESAGWDKEDAIALASYLQSKSGVRLRLALRNMALRQQVAALTKTSGLEWEAGYCNGQNSVLAAIESMADTKQFPVEEVQDSDPQTSQ